MRLLINRNEQQRLVAQSVATMWHNVLGIETEIVIKNWDEYEAAIREGDYDVVRRGLVMQNHRRAHKHSYAFPGQRSGRTGSTSGREAASPASAGEAAKPREKGLRAMQPIETEAQALRDLSAMPIYFASSYSLVKPYVSGFDSNVLDTPSLKAVRINIDWKQSGPAKGSP